MISKENEEWYAENYPMKPDNPLIGKTDDEIRAYIREKRAAMPEVPFTKSAENWCRKHEELRPCLKCLRESPNFR